MQFNFVPFSIEKQSKMNSLVFIVVLGLFSVSLGADLPTCPPEDPPFPVYFPDTTNCSQFYECDSGTPFLQTCQAGLEFDPVLDVCDTPSESKCNYSSTIVLDESLKTKTIPNQINKGNGRRLAAACLDLGALTPNPADCQTYFECTLEGPILLTCPLGTEFNPIELICDRIENANCQAITCSNVGEALPNPLNCKTYFECTLDGPVLMPCPPGLQFDKNFRQCDLPDRVQCATSRYVKQANHHH